MGKGMGRGTAAHQKVQPYYSRRSELSNPILEAFTRSHEY